MHFNLPLISVKTALKTLPDKCNPVKLIGWVKALRDHKKVIFLDLNDGSCIQNLQVILKEEQVSKDLKYGCSVEIKGNLAPSLHPKQKVELICEDVKVLGTNDVDEFPFKARKIYKPEFLRQFYHLRAHTRFHSCLIRIRSALVNSITSYFKEHNYYWVDTPSITKNNCEGGGEVFLVEKNGATNQDPSKESSVQGHFFDHPTYLTVSRQLHLESLVCGMSKVYTYAPNFRAENTRTRQHMSEFYMLEVEEVTSSLNHLLELTEDLVKTITKNVLETCPEEVDWIKKCSNKNIDITLDSPFTRMSYSDAIEILQKHPEKFKFKPEWGLDLKAEHEQFLVAHIGNKPIFVTHYPTITRPFYMKPSEENNKVVECFDLLAPYCGELCGGSLREDRHDILSEVLKAAEQEEILDWYLDLRKFGSVPHGGFGLGVDRYLMYLLNLHHIRDTISFPRITHRCPM